MMLGRIQKLKRSSLSIFIYPNTIISYGIITCCCQHLTSLFRVKVRFCDSMVIKIITTPDMSHTYVLISLILTVKSIVNHTLHIDSIIQSLSNTHIIHKRSLHIKLNTRKTLHRYHVKHPAIYISVSNVRMICRIFPFLRNV